MTHVGLGPVMIDIAGAELTDEDSELLRHPAVGGVILFSRNYQDPDQLSHLTACVRALRAPHLLVAVDHEGGRVQRFRDGFTALPPPAILGREYEKDAERGLALAMEAGWMMAAELRACGVDMSFAPVLDLDRGRSAVIGDRAFHGDPDVVTSIARAYLRGMREAGMAGVGKHFPGHGGVAEDSHETLPVERRDLESLRMADMLPFERLDVQVLPGIMTAHLLVPAVDEAPVSFSRRWLQEILRGEIGYRGAVFSDDLCMHGAESGGSPLERARKAVSAGCDMVLVCNDRGAAETIVAGLPSGSDPVRASRLARFHGRGGEHSRRALLREARHRQARAELERLDRAPELDLHDDNPA